MPEVPRDVVDAHCDRVGYHRRAEAKLGGVTADAQQLLLVEDKAPEDAPEAAEGGDPPPSVIGNNGSEQAPQLIRISNSRGVMPAGTC